MKNQSNPVQDEMRRLISRSCASSYPHQSRQLYKFQKELLRHFFKSVDVTIDHTGSKLILWNSEISEISEENNLYRLNDAVSLSISYSDLEQTLKGCLETRPEDTRFYRSLLLKYGGNYELDPLMAVSA